MYSSALLCRLGRFLCRFGLLLGISRGQHRRRRLPLDHVQPPARCRRLGCRQGLVALINHLSQVLWEGGRVGKQRYLNGCTVAHCDAERCQLPACGRGPGEMRRGEVPATGFMGLITACSLRSNICQPAVQRHCLFCFQGEVCGHHRMRLTGGCQARARTQRLCTRPGWRACSPCSHGTAPAGASAWEECQTCLRAWQLVSCRGWGCMQNSSMPHRKWAAWALMHRLHVRRKLGVAVSWPNR